MLAGGPAGLVAAVAHVTPEPTGAWPLAATDVATSSDGIHWLPVAASALPHGFRVGDLAGTATEYTAVGAIFTSAEDCRAVALSSANGRTWSRATAMPIAFDPSGARAFASRLVVGHRGLMADGSAVASTPSAELWWQSSDGRTWRSVPMYAPVGPNPCRGEGCGNADGSLLADGYRIVALRDHPTGVWTSLDGRAWRRLPMTGAIPKVGEFNGLSAALLPGGIVAVAWDGKAAWYGEAVVR